MEKKESIVEELLAILAKQGSIQTAELSAVSKAFTDSDMDQFDEFLIEQGLVQEEDLLKAAAEYFQVPFFDLKGYFFDTHLLHEFPKGVLLRNAMIPLEVIDESILIMICNRPDNQDLLPIIGKYVSYDVQFRVGLYLDICDAVKEFYDPSLTEGVAPDIYDDPDLPQELEEENLIEAEGYRDQLLYDVDMQAADNEEEDEFDAFDAD